MFAIVSGHIVECTKLIGGIYTNVGASHLHMKSFTYVAFEEHTCFVLYMVVG